jgi:hypothetical protein
VQRSAKPSSAQDKPAPQKVPAAADALEDSFIVDSSAAHEVPAATRQRSQTRPYKIRCPMCETVGYVPRSAAGKEIRCANRDCMVPIFTAPKPEKKKEEEEAPAKPRTARNLIMGLSALGLSAIAVWFYFKNQPEERPRNPQADQTPIRPAQTDPVKNEKPAGEQPPLVKPLILSEERGPALARMASAVNDQNHNRSRVLCERVTGHTAADCGDLQMAAASVERLQHMTSELGFYRVPPLTSIAWQQLKAGDRAAATKTLDQALSAAAELPLVGRFSIESAAWLAAALTAAGREKEVPALVERFLASGPTGRLFAAEARATAWNSCDVDLADQERPLVDAASLQLPVVVEITVGMGFPAEALRLAQSIAEPNLRAECEIVWVESVERAKSLKGTKALTGHDEAAPAADVLAKLKPADQARCHARLGLLRLRDKDQAGADAELKSALTSLRVVKPGPEFVLPSLPDIYQLKSSDPRPARQEALALAEIARLQASLGKANDADQSLAAALDYLRASAPSPVAVDAKLTSAQKDRDALRSELKATLKLSEARANPAVLQYRRNLDVLAKAAEARFALEVDLVDASLAWADPGALWKLVGKRSTDGDPERKEPFLTTPLPWQLLLRLESRPDPKDAKTLASVTKAVREYPAPAAALLEKAIAEFKQTETLETARHLKSVEEVEPVQRERAGLIIADRLVRDGQFARAFEFARLIEDPLLKEETMQWTAALACRLGEGPAVKKTLHASNSSFLPTQLVAAYRGFLIGLLARERAEPAAASASSAAAQPPVTQPPPGGDTTGGSAKPSEPSKG